MKKISSIYIIMIFIFVLSSTLLAIDKQIPADADEGYFSLTYARMGMDVSTWIIDDTHYLPLISIFSFLKIYYVAENNFYQISGFYINPQDLYKIDFEKLEFELKGKRVSFEKSDFYVDELEVFVSQNFLEKTFGIKSTVNMLRLRIDLVSDDKMPILLEKGREREYKFLSKRDDQYAPLVFKKRFNIINGGILNYDVSYQERNNQTQNTTYNLNLGMQLLGGGFNVQTRGHYDFEKKQNLLDNKYSLKYMFQNKYISQLIMGDIQFMNFRSSSVGSMSLRDEPLRGVMITNETAMFHSDHFTDLRFSDYIGQDWQTELYLNGTLFEQMRTGSDGFYNYNVPINYGLSNIELKYYGPMGEYREEKKSYNVLNNFLAPGDLKYSLWGGQSTFRGQEQFFANANASFGIFTWLTNTVRLKYAVETEEIEYMNQLSASLFRNIALSLAYSPAFGANAGLNFNSRGTFFSLNYSNPLTKENGEIDWNLGTASLNGAFNNIFKLPLSLSFNGSHSQMPEQRMINISSSLSSYFKSVSLRARYRGNYLISDVTERDPIHHVEMSASYYLRSIRRMIPFIDYMRIEATSSYNVITQDIMLSSLGIGASFFRYMNFSFSISQDYITNSVMGSAGLSFNSSILRSNSKVDYRNNEINSISQSLQGVVAFDPSTASLNFNNTNPYNNQFGISGANIRFFKDLNNNGKLDKGEPIIEGVKIKMGNNRSGSVSYKNDMIVIANLVPNYRYNVTVDMKSFKEPIWLPKYEEFSFISDPNSYKSIEVPCLSTGIIEGSVKRMVAGKVEPQNRVRVHIVSDESDYRETVPVFSDGSYYKMGIIPGKYRAYVDSLQLSILDVKSEPEYIVFEVKTSANGDYIGEIDFMLHPTTTPREDDDEQLPVGGEPVERTRIKN